MSEEQSPSRYEILAEKWLTGTITPEEAKEYADWYNAGQDAPVDIPAALASSESDHEQRMLRQIKNNLGMQQSTSTRVRKYVWWAAAAILLGVVTTSYLLTHRTPTPQPPLAAIQDVMPGSDKAILTLGNGQQVILDSSSSGQIAAQGNVAIIKKDDGSLLYTSPENTHTHEVLYNTLTVPRGGQYKLTLPDGSRVWLNAASTLKYPTAFTGPQRIIELNGEGYFEVAPQAGKPFFVYTRQVKVAVLGTSFNIMSYPDEKNVYTTLLSGAVKVTSGQQEKLLTPGHQAIADNDNNEMLVQEVETSQTIAWKEGMFRFAGNNIPMVLRQISRWYDIDIEYQGTPPSGHLTGKVPRQMPLSDVMRILELSGVHSRLEKGKLIVSH